jgi:hypothetical protein
MVASSAYFQSDSEHLLAELTAGAYQVALRHGFRGSFLDVELELWHELRAVLAKPRGADNGRGAVVRKPFKAEAHERYCQAQLAGDGF